MALKILILDIAGFIIGFIIWQIAKCTDSKIGKALIICALFVFVNYIILILGLPGDASGILWAAEIVALFLYWLAGKRKTGLSESEEKTEKYITDWPKRTLLFAMIIIAYIFIMSLAKPSNDYIGHILISCLFVVFAFFTWKGTVKRIPLPQTEQREKQI